MGRRLPQRGYCTGGHRPRQLLRLHAGRPPNDRRLGEEPTYRLIEQGHWHANRPYGTIHRMASDGHTHGIARASFDYCAAQTDYLRIDTHADNRPMLRAITRYGFRPCGIIYVRDGSPRLAFDLERPSAGRP